MMLIGNKIIRLEETGSTNDYACNLLKKNKINDGTVILAEYQQAGRGHSGSVWESDKGLNLLMSLVIFPGFLKAGLNFNLSKFVSLAIVSTIKSFVENTCIKWPNDIFCNNKKICGMLIKNSILGDRVSSSVIGLGININQKSYHPDLNATSLQLETGKEINIEDFTGKLLGWLNYEYEVLKKKEYAKINERYTRQLFKLNEFAAYKDSTGEFKGILTGIDNYGNLLVKKENGEPCTYGFKEIIFL